MLHYVQALAGALALDFLGVAAMVARDPAVVEVFAGSEKVADETVDAPGEAANTGGDTAEGNSTVSDGSDKPDRGLGDSLSDVFGEFGVKSREAWDAYVVTPAEGVGKVLGHGWEFSIKQAILGIDEATVSIKS